MPASAATRLQRLGWESSVSVFDELQTLFKKQATNNPGIQAVHH